MTANQAKDVVIRIPSYRSNVIPIQEFKDNPYYGMCYPLSEQNRSQMASPVMVRRSSPTPRSVRDLLVFSLFWTPNWIHKPNFEPSPPLLDMFMLEYVYTAQFGSIHASISFAYPLSSQWLLWVPRQLAHAVASPSTAPRAHCAHHARSIKARVRAITAISSTRAQNRGADQNNDSDGAIKYSWETKWTHNTPSNKHPAQWSTQAREPPFFEFWPYSEQHK